MSDFKLRKLERQWRGSGDIRAFIKLVVGYTRGGAFGAPFLADHNTFLLNLLSGAYPEWPMENPPYLLIHYLRTRVMQDRHDVGKWAQLLDAVIGYRYFEGLRGLVPDDVIEVLRMIDNNHPRVRAYLLEAEAIPDDLRENDISRFLLGPESPGFPHLRWRVPRPSDVGGVVTTSAWGGHWTPEGIARLGIFKSYPLRSDFQLSRAVATILGLLRNLTVSADHASAFLYCFGCSTLFSEDDQYHTFICDECGIPFCCLGIEPAECPQSPQAEGASWLCPKHIEICTECKAVAGCRAAVELGLLHPEGLQGGPHLGREIGDCDVCNKTVCTGRGIEAILQDTEEVVGFIDYDDPDPSFPQIEIYGQIGAFTAVWDELEELDPHTRGLEIERIYRDAQENQATQEPEGYCSSICGKCGIRVCNTCSRKHECEEDEEAN